MPWAAVRSAGQASYRMSLPCDLWDVVLTDGQGSGFVGGHCGGAACSLHLIQGARSHHDLSGLMLTLITGLRSHWSGLPMEVGTHAPSGRVSQLSPHLEVGTHAPSPKGTTCAHALEFCTRLVSSPRCCLVSHCLCHYGLQGICVTAWGATCLRVTTLCQTVGTEQLLPAVGVTWEEGTESAQRVPFLHCSWGPRGHGVQGVGTCLHHLRGRRLRRRSLGGRFKQEECAGDGELA